MIKRVIIVLAFVVNFIFITSSTALAHVKWFVARDGSLPSPDYHYTWTSPAVLVWILIFIALITLSYHLDKRICHLIPGQRIAIPVFVRIFSVLVGIALVFAAYYSEAIFAAHYIVTNRFLFLLQFIEAAIGLMLISQISLKTTVYPFIPGNLIAFLYGSIAVIYGFTEVFDYINFLGIAVFLIFHYSGDPKIQQFAVPSLRVFTGLALIVLALSEKLLNPDLGYAFLSIYDWNFMKMLGMNWYTNELFVLSAGFMELIFGINILLGFMTRVTTAVVATFMVISNLTFVFQQHMDLAITELIGHLPIVATAIVLVVHGSGNRLLFGNMLANLLISDKRGFASPQHTVGYR